MPADLLYKNGSNWVSLLYPVGSIYMSKNATSPASTVGGTWTQISGAVLAAYGANGFTLNNYGGSLKIATTQIPSHNHSGSTSSAGSHSHEPGQTTDNSWGFSVYKEGSNCFRGEVWNGLGGSNNAWGVLGRAQGNVGFSTNTASAGAHTHSVSIGNTGGGQIICLTTMGYMSGSEPHKISGGLL